VRLGCGVYGLAFTSGVSERPTLYSPARFHRCGPDSPDELGVEWSPTEREVAFQEGAERPRVPARRRPFGIRRHFFPQIEASVRRSSSSSAERFDPGSLRRFRAAGPSSPANSVGQPSARHPVNDAAVNYTRRHALWGRPPNQDRISPALSAPQYPHTGFGPTKAAS